MVVQFCGWINGKRFERSNSYHKLGASMKTYMLQGEKGLSDEEIREIEEKYEIVFPEALKIFYKNLLPVSEGFINWRDASSENVAYIKSSIANPIEEFKENAQDVYWNDNWGEEPATADMIKDFVLRKMVDAPKLIPIYSHRYMPMGVSDNPPVISVYGVDVIYYGKDLDEYIQIEFGEKNPSEIDYSNIQKIPFWSEMM